MALDSYSGLKQSIIDHLDRDDLTNFVDDFIDIAESRHKREVRIRDMITRETLIFATRYVDLPAKMIEARSLRLLTDPITVIRYINPFEMTRRRVQSPEGTPTAFTIHEQIEFDREPDQAYSGEIIYYKELSALSDAQTSNALLRRAPEVYLYSSLVAAEPFLMNDERIMLWEGMYSSARDALNQVDLDATHIGPLVSSVDGLVP